MFGVRRGGLRQWAWSGWLLLALALTLLMGGAGFVLGVLSLGYRFCTLPPRHAALVYFPNHMPCLWLDTQRVVLGRPYRVVYRDELQPADFARLRRLCRGLPA